MSRRGWLGVALAALAVAALAPQAQGAFPGRNGLIASERTAYLPAETWLVDPRSGDATLFREAAEPAWSPDGTKLLLRTGLTGYELHILDLAGTEYPHNGCRAFGRTYPSSPSWSPDGKHFVFSCQSSNGAILVGTLGTGLGYATPLTDEGRLPTWSPDGRTIAFVRFDSGIWLLNADGTNLRYLVDLPGGEGRPDWSPNSRRLVFHADSEPPPGGCCGDGNRDVFKIRVTGRGLTRLTTTAGDDINPAFAPNGRQIVFASDRLGHRELYLMSSKGAAERRLTHTQPHAPGPAYFEYTDPDWQPHRIKGLER